MLKAEKKKIAFVTHWPEEQSAIGDYCFELVKRLTEDVQDFSIDVFTDERNSRVIPKVSLFKIPTEEWDKRFSQNIFIRFYYKTRYFLTFRKIVKQLKDYDLVVYELGNSPKHFFQYELIKQVPGIAHFHDFIYQDFFISYYWSYRKKPHLYHEIMKKYAPDLPKQSIPPQLSYSEKIANPFLEEIANHSKGCIVHANFSRTYLQEKCPLLKVFTVPLLMGNLYPNYKSHDDQDFIHFGIFGNLTHVKLMDEIIDVFHVIGIKHKNWKISIVGEILIDKEHLSKKIKKARLEDKITFFGKTSENRFYELFYTIDYLINLRYPSYGESSATLATCLQIGIPGAVTDILWYSEQPDFIDKIPYETTREGLTKILDQYLENPDSLHKKKSIALAYAKGNSYASFVSLFKETLKKLDSKVS